MHKELGKIQSATFGLGGYQETQVGLWLMLGGTGWGVQTSYTGGWSFPPDEYAKWTLDDQTKSYAAAMRDTIQLLKDAKVDHVGQLVGIPVEVTFDGQMIQSFRVLKEVL